MKIEIREQKKDENVFILSLDKTCLNKLKSEDIDNLQLGLDFNLLNLGEKLYGNTKKESILIQKRNCKIVLSYFKIVKKAIKILGERFNGTFAILGLNNKKNNNDFMLSSMLEISFEKRASRMRLAYETACDFLDKENSINNMCDFRDNACAKHREKGIDKETGCCPSFCKLRECGKACTHKNLSCKIFMCDYLIYDKGFYFTPNTIPVLKQHMTIFERATCFGLLCRTEKKAMNYLWMIRALTFCYILVMIGIIAFFAI